MNIDANLKVFVNIWTFFLSGRANYFLLKNHISAEKIMSCSDFCILQPFLSLDELRNRIFLFLQQKPINNVKHSKNAFCESIMKKKSGTHSIAIFLMFYIFN